MELIITFPFLFSFIITVQNLQKQTVTFFNLSILSLSIYVMAHFFVNNEGYAFIAAILFNHFTPLYLLVGPFFYIFILIQFDIISQLRKIDVLHFIPSLVQLISITPYFVLPWEDKITLIQKIYENPSIQGELDINMFFSPEFNYIFRLLHFLTYCMMSLRVIIKKTHIREKEHLKSLKKITGIFILLALIYLIHIFIIIVEGTYKNLLLSLIIYIDIILFLGLMFELFKFPELLFNKNKFKNSYLNKSPFIKTTPDKNLIPKDVYSRIGIKLNEMINEPRFLIDSETNFDVFAKEINENKYHIRLYLKCNGLSFIKLKNKVRVEEAIKHINSKKPYKLDYIANKCGFNSPSNFYKIFKNITGYTPSEFEKTPPQHRRY